jgi:hypothetical protein
MIWNPDISEDVDVGELTEAPKPCTPFLKEKGTGAEVEK